MFVESLTRDALFSLVDVALERVPNLNHRGVCKPHLADRESLLNEKELRLCVQWLARIRPIETPSIGSYACKHMVEVLYEEARGHIPNGVFIAAALGLDYTFRIDSPNVDFGFSMRDIRRNDYRQGSRMWQEQERKREAEYKRAMDEELEQMRRKVDERIMAANVNLIAQRVARKAGV